jgi:hypothetical protein
MNKQVLFALLFSCWTLGIFLICLFPPIPDYQIESQNSEYLCTDSIPELYQRNSGQLGVLQFDLGVEMLVLPSDFRSKLYPRLSAALDLNHDISEVSSFFDTKLIFQAFFETW